MVMEALGFSPFSTVKTNHLIIREHKLQLSPYQAAFTMNSQ